MRNQKHNKYKYFNKPKPQENTPICILKPTVSIAGCHYRDDYVFESTHTVPIFEAYSVHGLNQIIGYAKFINKSYGDVYYRGECKLHKSLLPSLFRGKNNATSSTSKLKKLIKTIADDSDMINHLKLNPTDSVSNELKIESVLQHYGIPTRFLDIVDNHWVALWMGLNKNISYKNVKLYNHYVEREIPLIDFVDGKSCTEEDLFQYILLIAVPSKNENNNTGIYTSADYYKVDLRQALPSTYLRPHAQHGLVVRKRPHGGGNVNKYDMSDNVVGIVKIRIDRVKQWIGNGELLSQSNLFPPPAYDNGYDILLSRTDLFTENFKIAEYV